MCLSCILAGFQEQDFQHLQFPSEMRIDYVRIYQRDDVKDGLGCDPSSHPTSDYITEFVLSISIFIEYLLLIDFFQPCECVQQPKLDDMGSSRI